MPEDDPQDAAPERRLRMLAAVVESVAGQVAVVGEDGTVVYENAAARRLYGPMLGRHGAQFVHPDDLEPSRARALEVAAVPGSSGVLRVRLRSADGRWLHVDVRVVNLLDDPAVRGLVFLSQDVTAQVQLERERARLLAGQRLVAGLGVRSLTGTPLDELTREALEGLAAVLDVSYVSLVVADGDGLRLGQQVGPDPLPAGHPLTEEGLFGHALRAGGPVVVDDSRTETRFTPAPELLARGVVSALAVPLPAAPGPAGVLAVHATRPVRFGETERHTLQSVANVLAGARQAEARQAAVRHQALHDPLTGLANRLLLEDRLVLATERAARDGTTVALLLVDLDDFKGVNDAHGHAAGDAVLVELGARLRTAFRPGDTVARLGGDEFVVLCPDLADAAEAEPLLARVTGAWVDPFTLPGPRPGTLSLRGTVGMALARGREAPAARLLAEADAAMYARKRRAR